MTILTNTNTVVQVGDSTFQITERDLSFGLWLAILVAAVYVACRFGYRKSVGYTRQAQDEMAIAELAQAARDKSAKLGIMTGN